MLFSGNTIFAKIFKVLFLAIVAFSIIVSVYFISKQKAQILESLESEANSIAKMITYASSDAIVLDDGAYLVEFNYEFVKESKNLNSLILSKNNQSNYIIRKESWSFKKDIPSIFSKQQQKNILSQIIYSPISNEKVFHYVFPIKFHSVLWGWLHLNMSLDDYEKRLQICILEFFYFFLSSSFAFFNNFIFNREKLL